MSAEGDCGDVGREESNGAGSASTAASGPTRGGPAVSLAALAFSLCGALSTSAFQLRFCCHALVGAVGGLEESTRLQGTMVEGAAVKA